MHFGLKCGGKFDDQMFIAKLTKSARAFILSEAWEKSSFLHDARVIRPRNIFARHSRNLLNKTTRAHSTAGSQLEHDLRTAMNY
jgi:hypothetical protein